ncbi:hypothetical protein DENIS_2853 [Desulfonema ishimotonii]|uniref:Solute-binding protein family 3/N-terminal domain-containing protein n=1 Tax=Desulfonema ishimotonii TaxID=45657 RepID=A0A401FY47_9BACT|nr:TIGR02285 family protein [Desulfonema ishimotonii]GBC61891.1 hypothetical protein DENIS_2853 [Desulfonema ishimotonii]
MKKSEFLFAVICFCFLYTEAAAKDAVLWYLPNFPPYVIVQGQDKDLGIDNQIIQELRQKLPEYEHQLLTVNYKRALRNLKQPVPAAITPLFKTPDREKYILYSGIPSYLVLPNGVVIAKSVRKKFTPFLQNDGKLDIEALIRSKTVKIGIDAGRSYSGIIDEMIRKYRNSGVFIEVSGEDMFLNLIRLMLRGRIDAAFGFPVEARYLAKLNGIDKNLLEALPVSGMEPFTPVYVGASKTRVGEKMIARINDILREAGTIERFTGFYEYWLDDTSKDHYRKLVKEYYRDKTGSGK